MNDQDRLEEYGPREELKQYGLPRTGTNLVCVTMNMNYWVHMNVNQGGWKHGANTLCLHDEFKDPYKPLPLIVVLDDEAIDEQA